MTNAVGIAWERVWVSRIGSTIHELCRRYDINLHQESLRNVDISEHIALFKDYQNIITWGCYHVEADELLAPRNVLYLENDFFGDKEFFYIDAYGWHAKSSLVQCHFNREEPTMVERDDALSYLEQHYDMELFQGPNKGGHILVCLQSLWEWDLRLLELVDAYMGEFSIVVRRHPLRNENSDRVLEEFLSTRPHWTLEPLDVELSDSLDSARAVVTNFSTVSFQALMRGIPCATCMPGYFTNSHCTFEVDRNPRMLRHIDSYDFDREAAERMLVALFKSRVRKDSTVDDLLENVHVASWIVGLRR